MSRTYKLTHTVTINHMEEDVVVEFKYHEGRPAVMYLRNGDPGYPEEPPEIEIVQITPAYGGEIGDELFNELDEQLQDSQAFMDAAWEVVEAANSPEEV